MITIETSGMQFINLIFQAEFETPIMYKKPALINAIKENGIEVFRRVS